jgi:Xaa-Pro dipeptidase
LNKARWDKLVSEIKARGVQGMVMVPGPNFFYMTGLQMSLSERPTLCLVTSSGHVSFIMPKFEAQKGHLVIHRLEDAEVFFPYSVIDYSDEEGPCKAFEQVFCNLQSEKESLLAIEFGNMRVLEYSLIKEVLGDFSFQDAGDIFKKLRIIKDEEELENMKKACRLCDKGVDMARSLLKVGSKATDVVTEIERYLKAEGAMSVDMSLATGIDTALPHAQTSERPIQEGDLAWLDLMVNVNGYWGDITRTYVFGTPPEEIRRAYEVVLRAQEHARLNAKAGMTGAEIDALARDFIESYGFGSYFTHRTGHGIGLEVHEEPYIVGSNTEPLDVGTTFTIEPGIYIPGKGGVRIEDDLVLTEDGAKSLTSYPRNLLDSETKLVV